MAMVRSLLMMVANGWLNQVAILKKIEKETNFLQIMQMHLRVPYYNFYEAVVNTDQFRDFACLCAHIETITFAQNMDEVASNANDTQFSSIV